MRKLAFTIAGIVLAMSAIYGYISSRSDSGEPVPDTLTTKTERPSSPPSAFQRIETGPVGALPPIPPSPDDSHLTELDSEDARVRA